MFAIWRVPGPWQPLTKKGLGVRMGSGKGSIDHYATPIKAGRVILEVAGRCEYAEVNYMKCLKSVIPIFNQSNFLLGKTLFKRSSRQFTI